MNVNIYNKINIYIYIYTHFKQKQDNKNKHKILQESNIVQSNIVLSHLWVDATAKIYYLKGHIMGGISTSSPGFFE